MNESIIHITEAEFNSAGTLTSNSTEVIFAERTFIKGITFSIRLQEQAEQYCNNLANANLQKLLVEGKYSLTVWTEKTIEIESKTQELKTNTASKIQVEEKLISTKLSNIKPSLSSDLTTNSQKEIQPLFKKIIRKYRGQTYEETIAINSESAINSDKNRRKYRGQYID